MVISGQLFLFSIYCKGSEINCTSLHFEIPSKYMDFIPVNLTYFEYVALSSRSSMFIIWFMVYNA